MIAMGAHVKTQTIVAAAALLIGFSAAAFAAEGNPIGGVGVSVESNGGIVANKGTLDAKGAATFTLRAGAYQISFTNLVIDKAGGAIEGVTVKSGDVTLFAGDLTCKAGGTTCGPTTGFRTTKDGPIVVAARKGRGVAVGRGGGSY